MSEKKLNGTVIVTYRCNARCTMCNRYKAPSKPEEEITIDSCRGIQYSNECTLCGRADVFYEYYGRRAVY